MKFHLDLYKIKKYKTFFNCHCITIFLGSIEFCTYDEYNNTTLKHSDLLLSSLNGQQCRQKCDSFRSFNCRAYSTVPTANTINCILHSEDSKLVGPKLLTPSQGNYYEKARCLNSMHNILFICDD